MKIKKPYQFELYVWTELGCTYQVLDRVQLEKELEKIDTTGKYRHTDDDNELEYLPVINIKVKIYEYI